MELQHNNAPILGKFLPNVVRRVLGPAVTCQQILHAKKNAFQDADVLMINYWTTQEFVYLHRNVHASFKERLLKQEKAWTLANAQHGEYP